MKKTIVKIRPGGKIEMEHEGFLGNDCIQDTKKFAKLIGKVASQKRKAEHYHRNTKGTTETHVGD